MISTTLIICTLIIFTQLRFIKHKNLGFNKEQILVIPLTGDVRKSPQVFKSEVQNIPGIAGSALSSHVPGRGRIETLFKFEGLEEGEPQTFPLIEIDEDYVGTMELQISQGRNFSPEFPGDKENSMLVNETLIKKLGWKDPLGKRVFMTDVEEEKFIQVPYHIIGVVKDFYFESLHHPLEPLLLKMPRDIGCLSIKVATDDISDVLGSLEAIWKKMEPARPFEYFFLDDTFDQLYQSEQKIAEIFFVFSSMAIFIACLGLFGLSSYNTEQRTREMGIRKVLGASSFSLFLMMSRNFLNWVILANLIAWPLAYLAIENWLDTFAYHIEPGIWIFLLSGFLTLFIALGTVSFHIIRVANSNPVNALRYE
jgi:putative ABC transport system permease protein